MGYAERKERKGEKPTIEKKKLNTKTKTGKIAKLLAAIRFARFFSFRFRTRPRTFYGASELCAKARKEMFTSFSDRALPCGPLKAIGGLRTNRSAVRVCFVQNF